ncbi:MAG TPA: transcription antitermination factor NusB, partial [Ilumatobacter sp.]|nr:transcription antitermination factor NusB [Ilumatobacter sp.]
MTSSRRLAYQVLRRIDSEGAYANLTVAAALDRSDLSAADRRFVTDLVYGTTRMRRACDALVDRFVTTPPDPATRTLLRLGAYQLCFAGVAAHAAVGETVALAPKRTRGFVNAVLRKVATTPMVWPSEWARLSYPDWIADTLVAALGPDDAHHALERMNAPATVTTRPDGYVQDLSSQWVASAVEAMPDERILDMCAAPGGKSTVLAATGAHVIATDIRATRLSLVVGNIAKLGYAASMVLADGTAPPFRAGGFDAVLVDAPCSGLGALRRR